MIKDHKGMSDNRNNMVKNHQKCHLWSNRQEYLRVASAQIILSILPSPSNAVV